MYAFFSSVPLCVNFGSHDQTSAGRWEIFFFEYPLCVGLPPKVLVCSLVEKSSPLWRPSGMEDCFAEDWIGRFLFCMVPDWDLGLRFTNIMFSVEGIRIY